MGAFTPFLYAFRERERILDLFEAACGARLTYSYITIGGVTDDLPERFIDVCREFLDYFEPKIDEYNNLLSLQPHLRQAHRQRRRHLRRGGHRLRPHRPGRSAAAASSGTSARSTPTAATTSSTSTSPSATAVRGVVGDCWDRYFVRILEMQQSVRILRQALDRLAGTRASTSTRPARSVKLPTTRSTTKSKTPAASSASSSRATARQFPIA